jgi:hypothetical protein
MTLKLNQLQMNLPQVMQKQVEPWAVTPQVEQVMDQQEP